MKKLILILTLLSLTSFAVMAEKWSSPPPEPMHPNWDEIKASYKEKSVGNRRIKNICRTILEKGSTFAKITAVIGVTIDEAVIGESCPFKRVNNTKFNKEYKGTKAPPIHTMVLSAGKATLRLREIIRFFVDNKKMHLLEKAFNQKDAKGRDTLELLSFANWATSGKKKGLGVMHNEICGYKRYYNMVWRNNVFHCPPLDRGDTNIYKWVKTQLIDIREPQNYKLWQKDEAEQAEYMR